jgi:hypothetical protein
MVCLVSRWLKKQWILVGDGAYACMDLALTCIKLNVVLISRLRLDAQLYEFPVFEKKKLGRKPIKGKRIQLKELLNDPKQLIPSIGMVVRRVKSNTSPLYAYGIMQDARPSDYALCLLKHQAGKMKLKLFSAPIRL